MGNLGWVNTSLICLSLKKNTFSWNLSLKNHFQLRFDSSLAAPRCGLILGVKKFHELPLHLWMSPSKGINEDQNSWLKFLKWNFLIFWCDLSVHYGWMEASAMGFSLSMHRGKIPLAHNDLHRALGGSAGMESWTTSWFASMGWLCDNFRDLTRKMTCWLLQPFRWHQENWPEVHF